MPHGVFSWGSYTQGTLLWNIKANDDVSIYSSMCRSQNLYEGNQILLLSLHWIQQIRVLNCWFHSVPSPGMEPLSASYIEVLGMPQIVKSTCATSLIEVRSDSQSDNCCFLCSDLFGSIWLCCAVTVKARQDMYQPFNTKLFDESFHNMNTFHTCIEDFFFWVNIKLKRE